MALRPNTIKPGKGARKVGRRVGRGDSSRRGNYSGRGSKGQRARSGGRRGLKRKGFKPFLQSTPKLPGFKSLFSKPAEIRLGDLDKKYNENDVVNLVSLRAKKLVGNNIKTAKILASGQIKKKLIISGVVCTAKAAELIKMAGGQVRPLDNPAE